MIKVQSVELFKEKSVRDPRSGLQERSFDIDREPLGSFPAPRGVRREKLEIGYAVAQNLLFFKGWKLNDAEEWVQSGHVVATSAMNADEIVFLDAPEFKWESFAKQAPTNEVKKP